MINDKIFKNHKCDQNVNKNIKFQIEVSNFLFGKQKNFVFKIIVSLGNVLSKR